MDSEGQTRDVDSEVEIRDFEELSSFLSLVLDRVASLWDSDSTSINAVQMQIVTVDRIVSFMRSVSEMSDASDDRHNWHALGEVFSEVLVCLQQRHLELLARPTTITSGQCSFDHTGEPGRPSYQIPSEMLEDLRGYGFSWTKIADMLGVSRWTVHRRVRQLGLQCLSQFSLLSDTELDEIISDYMNRHGTTSGQTYIIGYLRSLGVRVQRNRVRESMSRLNPDNALLRWGMLIERRRYHVAWPNSLWHLDGHHSLIRWNFVVHGCIDGFSRRIIFLECSPNNLSETVLTLFLNAIERDGGLWPSRIRVDRGVENVLVCDAMVQARGEGRGSFIAGSSTHNQRIERLWRDVFRCVLHYFYYVFYAMEDAGIFYLDNPTHVFVLHHIYLPRINQALHEYTGAFNNHGVRTANNWSPEQMWLNGMMNADNPLAQGIVDEDPGDLQYYGYDPEGPSPFEESNNNVVVPASNFDHATETLMAALAQIDPFRSSTQMGIDIYCEVLHLVEATINYQERL